MENIHTLDNEIVNSLINMFNSKDQNNIKLGLEILNNVNFNDEEVVNNITKIIDNCSNLYFNWFKHKENEDIYIEFYYNVNHYLNAIYAHKSLFNKTEWIMNELPIFSAGKMKYVLPHLIRKLDYRANDLNKFITFNYNKKIKISYE
jgi:hypothetical protein